MDVEFVDVLKSDKKLIEQVRNWRNSDEIRKYMYSDHYITKTEHQQWIEKLRTKNTAKAWIIKFKETPVGLVYLSNIDYKNRITDWGFYIADRSVRGKGVGSVTLYRLMELVFDEMNFNQMYTKVLASNTTALNLYEKFGFNKEGKLKEKLFRNGGNIDVLLVKMSKKKWNDIKRFI